MTCNRCPHHVRHGKLASDGKSIEFSDLCGLKVREFERIEEEKEKPVDKKAGASKEIVRKPKIYPKELECTQVPFPELFEFRLCNVYIATFKTPGMKNDVIPTKDFQYSDVFTSGSITDMELL